MTPIVGSDVNPQESAGLFDVMLKLETAIRDGDTRISNRLIPLLDEVIDRFASVRSDVGGRLRTLDEFKSQLLEEDTFLQEELSTAIDADIAEVVTRVTAVQSALQATLQIASVSNSLTILSFIGYIALAGVVVNDSLIFMEFYNHARSEGMSAYDACLAAARARLRAIVLTTVTTVLGLLPLMLEQSFQARFLIPMAITISCGLISATGIILIILPCLLLIWERIKHAFLWLWHGGTVPTNDHA